MIWKQTLALGLGILASPLAFAVDDACDGGGALDGEDPMSIGNLIINGSDGGQLAGYSTTTADVNGDSTPDLLIGAPGEAINGRDSGAVYVFQGPLPTTGTLSVTDADLVIAGAGFEENAGTSLSNIGDIDGDGDEEVLIGANPRPGNPDQGGVAYLLAGNPGYFTVCGVGCYTSLDLDTIDTATVRAKFRGVISGDGFGVSVGPRIDFNGDGVLDIVIGAPSQSGAGVRYGAVYVWFGSQAGDVVASSADVIINGPRSDSRFGASMTAADVLGGDGIRELVVGAPYDDQVEFRAGTAYIVPGQGTTTGETIDANALAYRIVGRRAHELGAALGNAGDLDNDGLEDLWVGAPGFASDYTGKVYGILSASLRPGPFIAEFDAQFGIEGESRSRFGTFISSVGYDRNGDTAVDGDTNGDGAGDALFGGFFASAPAGVGAGAAWLFEMPVGSRTSVAEADYKVFGDASGQYAGWSGVLGGDLDGDGYDDMLVTSLGNVAGVGGRVGTSTMYLGGEDLVDELAWYPDVDGDGYGDASATPVFACESPFGTPPVGWVPVGGDCNDGSGAFRPDAVEDCAAVSDFNCDGRLGPSDNDGDGYDACQECDDSNPNINPAAAELCGDYVDNNCNGLVDEGENGGVLSSGARGYFVDNDGDGYGDNLSGEIACSRPDGLVGPIVEVDGDCDDANYLVNPGRPEYCDSIDNDCAGGIDDNAVDARYWYADGDVDTYGSPLLSQAVKACSQPPGFVANRDDCDDSLSVVSPAGAEGCDAVDNDCDGLNYLGGPIVDDERAHYTVWGSGQGANLGLGELNTLGDLDLDGYDELVVSEPQYSGIYGGGGAVYIIEGGYDAGELRLGERLPDGQPLFRTRILGTRPAANLGWRVRVGDLNGDGEQDLVVSAPGARLPKRAQGGVAVYFGPVRAGDLLFEDADMILRGEDEDHRFGNTLAVGDLDGDGFDDMVIGSPNVADETTGAPFGRLYVVYGNFSLPRDEVVTTVAAATIDGLDNERIGQALAVDGDLDGDGNLDIIAGIGRMANLDESRLAVFHGTGARLAGAVTRDGTVVYDASTVLGSDVDYAGDIDGDGADDLVVGSSINIGPQLLFGDRISGRVFIGDLDHLSFEPGLGSLRAPGLRVAGVGDINGDGVPDFVLGGNRAQGQGGRAYLIYGNRSLRARAADFTTRQVPLAFIESFGRLDESGFPTYSYRNLRAADGSILGVEGATFITDGDATAITSLDFDGDGYRDLAIGSATEDLNPAAPNRGAVRVMLSGPYGLDARTFAGSGLNPAGEIIIREVYEGASFRKYVSLYNAGPDPVDLTGWSIELYSNGSATPSFSRTFSGDTIPGGANFVLLRAATGNETWFASSFGRNADLVLFEINHNGDDAYALVDPLGTRVDVYGEPGVDGTGEPWEGVNTVWKRNPSVFSANPVWTGLEWSSTTDLSAGTPFANESVAGVSFEVPGFDVVDWYLELDGDTYADESGVFLNRCEMHLPMDYTSDPSSPRLAVTDDDTRISDCDDSNASTYPGAPEGSGDLVDSNCDGLVDPAAAPVVDVEITPVSPLSNDTLTANVEVFDADTPIAGVVLYYQWFVGTSPDPASWTPLAGETNSTLGSGAFDKGDYVAVEVYGDDGTAQSDPVSDVVLVRNTRPTLTDCNLSPASAAVTDDITAIPAGLFDPDPSDTPTVDFQWWVFIFGTLNEVRDLRGDTDNAYGLGLPQWGATRPDCFGSNFLDSDPLAYLNCNRGSKLYARCIPRDSSGDGDYVRSPVIEIINAAPVVDQCDVTPLSPDTNDNLTVTASGSDPDPGDTVDLTYTWLRNGTPIPGFSNTAVTILPESQVFFPGQYSVICTPTDNFGKVGTPVTSAAALVGNIPPTQPAGLALSPGNTPRSNQAVSVVLTLPSFDPDVNDGTQTLTYQVQWFNITTGAVYNNPNPWTDSPNTSGTLATLPAAATTRAEDWEVRVRADDGFDTSAYSSLTFTVRNAIPSFTGANILPATPITTDDLTIGTTGWTDFDGDPELYDVAWFVNGVEVTDPLTPSTTLPSSYTARGDTIYAVVTPVNAGFPLDDGTPITTATVTVDNAAPTQPSVALAAEKDPDDIEGLPGSGAIVSPPPDQYDDIVCQLTPAVDVDGDDITYNVEWLLDDGDDIADYFVPNTPAPTGPSDQNWHLPYNQTTYGDRWKCRVTPFDDFGAGTPGPSAETPFVQVQDQTVPDAPVFDGIRRYQNETTIDLTGTCVSGSNDCSSLSVECTSPTAASTGATVACSANSFIAAVPVPRGHVWSCSGTCSDIAANTSPPSGAVTTEVCDPFDSYEINTLAGPAYGDTPGAAIDEWGAVPDDNSTSVQIIGNVLDPADVDWYRLTGSDTVANDLALGRDQYNFEVNLTIGVNDYDITVFRGLSPTNPGAVAECNSLGQYDTYSFYYWDTLRTPSGVLVDDRPLPADRQACGGAGNALFNECEDLTADYWVQVQRVDNDDCQHYRLQVTNGTPP